MNLRQMWNDYNLSIVLFLLFFTSWIGHGVYEWETYKQNAQEHNQEIRTQDYFNEFMTATLENWQSEFLQLFTMVVLTAYLVHKGSSESKDGEETTHQALERIEKKLVEMEAATSGKLKG